MMRADVTMLALLALVALVPVQKPKPREIGPPDLPLTFPVFPEIDRIGRPYGLGLLRSKPLPEGDLEVRIWHGFSWGTDVVVMSRRADVWRVSRSGQTSPTDYRKTQMFYKAVPPPKRGWADLWRDLDARGIRTIPDEWSLPDDGVKVYDGVKYLFEIRTGASYRAYSYDNPEQHSEHRYAPIVAKIVRVLERAMPNGRL